MFVLVVCFAVRTDNVVIYAVAAIVDVLDHVATTVVRCSASELSSCLEDVVYGVFTAAVIGDALDMVVTKEQPCFGGEVTFLPEKIFSNVEAGDSDAAKDKFFLRICGLFVIGLNIF